MYSIYKNNYIKYISILLILTLVLSSCGKNNNIVKREGTTDTVIGKPTETKDEKDEKEQEERTKRQIELEENGKKRTAGKEEYGKRVQDTAKKIAEQARAEAEREEEKRKKEEEEKTDEEEKKEVEEKDTSKEDGKEEEKEVEKKEPAKPEVKDSDKLVDDWLAEHRAKAAELKDGAAGGSEHLLSYQGVKQPFSRLEDKPENETITNGTKNKPEETLPEKTGIWGSIKKWWNNESGKTKEELEEEAEEKEEDRILKKWRRASDKERLHDRMTGITIAMRSATNATATTDIEKSGSKDPKEITGTPSKKIGTWEALKNWWNSRNESDEERDQYWETKEQQQYEELKEKIKEHEEKIEELKKEEGHKEEIEKLKKEIEELKEEKEEYERGEYWGIKQGDQYEKLKKELEEKIEGHKKEIEELKKEEGHKEEIEKLEKEIEKLEKEIKERRKKAVELFKKRASKETEEFNKRYEKRWKEKAALWEYAYYCMVYANENPEKILIGLGIIEVGIISDIIYRINYNYNLKLNNLF